MKKLVFTTLLLLVLTILQGCDQFTNNEITVRLLQGQDTVEINSEWVDAGARLRVNDTEYIATTGDEVDTSTLGLYEIEYTYTYEEEDYTIKRYVMVVDQTPPEIELNAGVDTITVGSTWEDAGVTITDNSLESLEATVEGTIDTSTPNTYTITYIVSDSSGNTSSVIRYVDVIE